MTSFVAVLVLCCFGFAHCGIFTPTFYQINLDFSQFTPDTNRQFEGITTISFSKQQGVYGLQEVKVDAELLDIQSVSVTDDKGHVVNVTATLNDKTSYSIWIRIDDTSSVDVTFVYSGIVGNVSDVGVFMDDNRRIIATNSYPQGAPRIFPCVNDPTIKTSVQMKVVLVNHDWGIHVLTDGIESPFLPVYAVGFIMTLHYRKVDDISTDKFIVWVPSYDDSLYDSVNSNALLKQALARGTYFYDFFEPAVLDKIHIVMVPDIPQQALVSHRLICIRPDVIVKGERETAEMAKGTVVSILNAISKMFFRCVVSPKNWEDFWLADSISLYLPYGLSAKYFQSWSFPELFTLDVQRKALEGSDMAIRPKSINPNILMTEAVYPSSYQGAAVLKMVEQLSSFEDISTDLLNYFKNFMYQTVDTDQFLKFMSNGSVLPQMESYGKRLAIVLDKWLYQVGYPVINNVTIHSSGFSMSQDKLYGDSTTSWIVPFEYTVETQKNSTLNWLSVQSSNFNASNIGPWININHKSKGLFRVNYGEDILSRLTDSSVYWSLDGVDRAVILDDSFHLSWTEDPSLSLTHVLSMIDMTANETDLTAFNVAMKNVRTLRHVYTQLGFGTQFDTRLAKITEDVYSRVNWYKDNKPTDLGKVMFARSVVQSTCDFPLTTCPQDAAKRGLVNNNIINDLLPTINCFSVRSDPQDKWADHFKALYNKQDTEFVRADALYALACPAQLTVNGSTAIKQFLDSINSDAILRQDALLAFSYIYSRPEHVSQAVNYIADNFTSLDSRFGDKFMAALITDLSQVLLAVTYSPQMDQIKELTLQSSQSHAAVVKAQDEMTKRNHIANINYNLVQNWLNTNGTIPPPPVTTQHPSSGASTLQMHFFLALSFLYLSTHL